MLEEKQFTMSQYLNQERRLEAKSDYYYMEAKRLNDELIAEQAENLKLCQRIKNMKEELTGDSYEDIKNIDVGEVL